MILLLPRKLIYGKFSCGWGLFEFPSKRLLCGGSFIGCIKYIWIVLNVK